VRISPTVSSKHLGVGKSIAAPLCATAKHTAPLSAPILYNLDPLSVTYFTKVGTYGLSALRSA
jgi:hypothetical protein